MLELADALFRFIVRIHWTAQNYTIFAELRIVHDDRLLSQFDGSCVTISPFFYIEFCSNSVRQQIECDNTIDEMMRESMCIYCKRKYLSFGWWTLFSFPVWMKFMAVFDVDWQKMPQTTNEVQIDQSEWKAIIKSWLCFLPRRPNQGGNLATTVRQL